MKSLGNFKQKLERAILDVKGTHHEFAYGSHGRKLDFDLIKDDSTLYATWVQVVADTIREKYQKVPDAILGVANGTNRLSRDVANVLGVAALHTIKVSPKEVALTDESLDLLRIMKSGFVVVVEDVGTSGGTAYSAARNALENGATKVEVLFTWKRQLELRAFEKGDIPYQAIIDEPLPTFTEEQCRAKGYCAQGWRLIEHSK